MRSGVPRARARSSLPRSSSSLTIAAVPSRICASCSSTGGEAAMAGVVAQAPGAPQPTRPAEAREYNGRVPDASREVRAIVSARLRRRRRPPEPGPRATSGRRRWRRYLPTWRVVRWILLPIAALVVLAVSGVAVAAYVYWPTDLPPAKALEEYTP